MMAVGRQSNKQVGSPQRIPSPADKTSRGDEALHQSVDASGTWYPAAGSSSEVYMPAQGQPSCFEARS